MAKTAKTFVSDKKQVTAGNVPLNIRFTGDVYSRIESARKKMGLLNPQELVRIAVASFLEKSGH